MRKITVKQELEIVRAYEIDLARCSELAEKYGITRAGIHRLLKRNGVDATKGGVNCRHDVTCKHCGGTFNVNRARLRSAKNLYCSKKCWLAHLDNIKIGKLSRAGLYQARKALLNAGVWAHLAPKVVVHHVDGNDNNNAISNLEIYATQGDHLRMHRGFDVSPIWRGIDFIKEAGNEHLS